MKLWALSRLLGKIFLLEGPVFIYLFFLTREIGSHLATLNCLNSLTDEGGNRLLQYLG